MSLQFFAAFLVSVFSFFSLLSPAPAAYEPKEAGALLNAAVLTDLHIGPRNPILQYNVNKAFRGTSAARDGADALVLLGDNTMDGMEQQSALFFAALKAHSKAANNLPVVGNHDLWGMGSYLNGKNRFISYVNEFTSNGIDNIYYHRVINGYYFIVLGTESDMHTTGHITDTQISWLDARLAEATAGGRPAFVFHHFPMIRVPEPERLENVLRAYPNVFYFSGHMHRALGSNTFIKAGDSLYYIDVPGFDGAEDDIWNYLGHGFQIEAYEGKVLIRARDYIRGEWLTEYEYSVDLVQESQEDAA